MKCAQCEDAEAVWECVDEDLLFCCSCSDQLHSKRARQHHHLVPWTPRPVCDECEEAPPDVECIDCGAGSGALVFCLACSATLHSRAVRAAHQVHLIGRLTVRGKDLCLGGRIIAKAVCKLKEDNNRYSHPLPRRRAEDGLGEDEDEDAEDGLGEDEDDTKS